MNTGLRNTLSVRPGFAAIAAALLLAPIASRAQENTAYGTEALSSNRSGTDNSAFGRFALTFNTTGTANTATGYGALEYNVVGEGNTATGFLALGSYNAYNGEYNTANGREALFNCNGDFNTATGAGALSSFADGSYNTALGYRAGANLGDGSNNIYIGNAGVSSENGVVRIGTAGIATAAYIAGIDGATGGDGLTVLVNSDGQLFTKKSSRRFKTDIHDMRNLSDRLMQLRPVTFRYKQAAPNGTHPMEYGLIAEEVARVFPDLVQYDKQGKPLAVYYDALAPMLLNELQKEHRVSITLKAARNSDHSEIKALKAELATVRTAQNSKINALTSQLAALRQSQQEQARALAQVLAASPNVAHTKLALYAQH